MALGPLDKNLAHFVTGNPGFLWAEKLPFTKNFPYQTVQIAHAFQIDATQHLTIFLVITAPQAIKHQLSS